MTSVSVTIRSYEREPMIFPLIDRLRDQTLKPLEIVIIDSGSGPAVIEPLRALAAKPATAGEIPIKLLEIPNRTYQSARAINQVIAASRGELAAILSQDALPTDDKYLELLAEPFREERVAGTYARQVLGEHYCPLGEKDLSRTYRPVVLHQRLPDIWFVNTCSMVRRSVWERFPFNEDAVITEDHEWAKQVMEAGYDIVYQGHAAVHHFHHRDGLKQLYKRFYQEGLGLGYIHQRRLPLWKALGAWVRELASDTIWLTRRGMPWYIPRSLGQRTVKYAGLFTGHRDARLHPLTRTHRGPLAEAPAPETT